jgi:hypothetical protein
LKSEISLGDSEQYFDMHMWELGFCPGHVFVVYKVLRALKECVFYFISE